MNDQDKIEFAELMNGLTDYYRARSPRLEKMGQVTLRLYFDSLKDYSMKEVSTAASQHIADQKDGGFFPVVSSFLKHLEGGEVTDEVIIAAAKNPTTPLGCFARGVIGSSDLRDRSFFELRERAAQCKEKVSEWKAKTKHGSYNTHQIMIMLKFKVPHNAPFHAGTAIPLINIDLVDKFERVSKSERYLRFIEPAYVHDPREIELTRESAKLLADLSMKNKKGGQDE